jgi:type I restriction enzyme S subunit
MAAIIDYRGKTPQKTSSGIPLITAKVVKGGRIETPDEFIAEEDYEAWMRRGMPEPGDVVITTEAPLGEVAQLGTEKVALAQRLIALRGRQGVLDNTFLKFLMQSRRVQNQLKARSSGTTVLGIRQSELRKVLLTLPPVTEQKTIAAVLGTLDDKIELNRRMNETLEGMALGLFKSWFVDFDPVRAKAEGQSAGLPDRLAALFPDSMKESQLGRIPKGWDVESLGNVLELAYGKALKEDDRQVGTVPVYGSNGQVGWHNEKLVSGPGIVVGRKGNPGVVTWAPTDFYPIDTTFYVVPKAKCHSLHFLFYALRQQDLGSLGADSAVPGLNRNMAYMSDQTLPTKAVLEAFDSHVEPIFRRIRNSNEQSLTLGALRDALLPKLISGELRIHDGEWMAGGEV